VAQRCNSRLAAMEDMLSVLHEQLLTIACVFVVLFQVTMAQQAAAMAERDAAATAAKSVWQNETRRAADREAALQAQVSVNT
jgi:hypothetical protein